MSQLERRLIDDQRISTISNFLSASECEELIRRAEESGFKPSPPSGIESLTVLTHTIVLVGLVAHVR